jgi:TonB-linked SusC/RagA family outer membrane protein
MKQILRAFYKLGKHLFYGLVVQLVFINLIDGSPLIGVGSTGGKINFKLDESNLPVKSKVAEVTISGTVVDNNGKPVPGVTVSVPGTTIGTATDLQGKYILSVSEGATLVFSFIGFETHRVSVGDQSVINVTLSEDMASLDEVIVVGYGTQKKSQLTGSIASVSSEDIQEVTITDAAQALQGRAAGVMALSSGNRPGEGVTLRVRGRRSLTASNDPLFVVDGIPLEGGINDINPRDILSMEVLKDASATAIYGSRGANGVVLVTTVRGGDYATTVSYAGYAGVSQVLGMPDMMNGEEFARMKEISGFEFTSIELDAIEKGISTDWLDLVTQNGFQQSHQLSVRGGNEKTQFFISANYFKENGVIKTQDFNRNTIRINLDHVISDKFKVGTSTQLSDQVQNWGDNVFDIALPSRPLSPVYDEEGNIFHNPGGDDFRVSPLRSLEKNASIDERSRVRMFSNIFAEYGITENLSYRMNFGADLQNYRRGVYQGKNIHPSLSRGTDLATKEHVQTYTYTFENIVNFYKDFAAIHALDVTGLYSFQTKNNESSEITGRDLPYGHQLFHNIGSAATIQSINSNLEEWGLMSFMARVNYRLMDKYLLTLTGRYDGSSRFSDDNKWGLFPSVALGWRISDETFMTNQTFFSELMLRASYGVTGNTAIDPYQTRGGLGRTAYSFGGEASFGFRPESIANSDLKWEKSKTINIGIDFGFWEDRIAASFELYQTNTSDLLLERVIPITSGYNSILQNVGDTRNKGFEFSLSSNNINNSTVDWTSSLNLFANKEEIVQLFDKNIDDVGNEWFIGEPLTVWYDHEKLGIWQTAEEDQAVHYGQQPGDIKVRDVNEDGIINEQDRVILGSDMPTLSIGIGNRISYGAFDFSFLLFGSFGHTIYNNFEVSNSTMVGRYNNLNVDYWTPENPTNDHPRPDGNVERPLYNTSRGYMSGDFLKVRNIQLGCNVPTTALSNYGIRSVRIYANADTPFVFSKLEGNLDPEQSGGNISGDTPSTRLFSLGVNIDF